MATTVKLSIALQIVTGGVTVVDREFISEYETFGKTEGDYFLDPTSTGFTLCVKGTNVATPVIVDPFVVGLASISGIALVSAVNLEISIDGGAPLKVAEGAWAIGRGEFQTIQITRDDVRAGQVEFVVWGDR